MKYLQLILIIASLVVLVGFTTGNSLLVQPQIIPIPENELLSVHPFYPNDEAFANNSLAKDVQDLLEKRIDYVFEKSQAVGLSAAVYIPGKGIWTSARYIDKKEYNNRIDDETMFHIASISKIFCSAIIFKLIENKQLSLQDRISKWFPDFPKSEQITVGNLLNHTSGIVSFEITKEYIRNKGYEPEQLVDIASKYDLMFSPGTAESYCNTGYVMLGLIAEKVLKQKYADIVKKEIIEPLHLKNTKVITAKENVDLIIFGHDQGRKIDNNEIYSNPFSAGDIASTPKDLVIFLQALYHGEIVSLENLNEMQRNMINISTSPPKVFVGKGIDAIVGTPIGDFYGHSGAFPGFYTALYYHPKNNIYVCVMMNDNKKPVEPGMFSLAELIINLK